jgi:hypothetical protein
MNTPANSKQTLLRGTEFQRHSIKTPDSSHQNTDNNAGFASKNSAVRFRMAS